MIPISKYHIIKDLVLKQEIPTLYHNINSNKNNRFPTQRKHLKKKISKLKFTNKIKLNAQFKKLIFSLNI